MKVLICYKVSNLNLSVQEAEYEGEVLDSLEELDTIEELEAALQDYYDSVAYEDELEGELLRVQGWDSIDILNLRLELGHKLRQGL